MSRLCLMTRGGRKSFSAIAMRLRAQVGGCGCADRFTSVQPPCRWLAAKDRIDVQMTVRNADAFETVRGCLEVIGYEMSAGRAARSLSAMGSV